jgi:hypothetical protein
MKRKHQKETRVKPRLEAWAGELQPGDAEPRRFGGSFIQRGLFWLLV